MEFEELFGESSAQNRPEGPQVDINQFQLRDNLLERFQNDTDCPICQENFQPNVDQVRVLPCGHSFHHNCLNQWLQDNSNCPSCRFELPRIERVEINRSRSRSRSLQVSVNGSSTRSSSRSVSIIRGTSGQWHVEEGSSSSSSEEEESDNSEWFTKFRCKIKFQNWKVKFRAFTVFSLLTIEKPKNFIAYSLWILNYSLFSNLMSKRHLCLFHDELQQQGRNFIAIL